ncbi:MAG: AAA family ATPase [Ignavibacteriales bacterium]|nr:AAA family ATPase [Ignavibacteriales bacterium]
MFCRNSKIFLLKGSAGTGKTTIIRIIIDLLKRRRSQICFDGTNRKSRRVIRDKTNAMATTIHTAIYGFDKFVEITESSDQQDSEEDNVLPMYKLRLKDTPGTQIYIVDEASMIGNSYSDGLLIRFGSSYLLDDLVKYSGFKVKI